MAPYAIEDHSCPMSKFQTLIDLSVDPLANLSFSR